MHTKRGVGEEDGMDWEIGIGMYALLCIKQTANENLLNTTGNYSMLCGDLNGK